MDGYTPGRGHIYYTPERIAAIIPAPLRARWGGRWRQNLRSARHYARAKGVTLAEHLANMARRPRKATRLSDADIRRALSFASAEARAYYADKPEQLAHALHCKLRYGYTLEESGARLGLRFFSTLNETREAREARIARLVAARKAEKSAPKKDDGPEQTPRQTAAVSRYRNCATCKHAGLSRCSRFPTLRADAAKVCPRFDFDGGTF